MKVVVFATILTLVNCKPNGLYHEEYNYRSSSSSFHNNELQHQKDDEGFYSKHGDLEGRIQPKVNAREQHSEYVNPKLKSLGYNSATASTYGQMQAGQQHYENVFQNGMFNHGGGVFQPYPHGSSIPSNYGIQSNLRQISTQVQQQLAQQLHEAIMNQYRRTSAYSNSLTQAQIEADRRLLEEELRRNVSMSLQDAIRMRYGTQAVRGGMSYSLVNGRLEPTANFNNQELSDLTRQLENNLIRQLDEGVRNYYHTTTTTSHRVTSVKQHQTNNNYGYPTYSSNSQLPEQRPLSLPMHLQPAVEANPDLPSPPQQRPLPLPMHLQPAVGANPDLPLPPQQRPLPLPMHLEPARIDYGPVVANPDSLTTIATRVQHDLNEHLNKILEDTRQRYFSTHSTYQQTQNWDYILQQLQNDLRNNVTHQFNLQLHQQPQRFRIEDLDNYKRQIENNLITRLNRDFNTQRDEYLRTHTTTSTGSVYGVRPNYYPNVNNYVSGINQEEWANIQRQIHDDLTRQLQVALMRQTHNYRGSSIDNFNYNTMLQQLTDELNRNLTQQIEHRLRQHYGHNFGVGQQYETQMAQLRNLLENDLQRQLRQGLQQYSQHYSWSSSSSSSSSASAATAGATNIKNYRPVRGFETFSIPLNNPDCMMGDDPSAYQQQEQNDDDLTQQLDDQDLTQQLENFDLNQKQSDDLTQQLQQQIPEKPPKSQKLEDLSDDQQQQQQQEIFPQSPGTYRHHHHFSNHFHQHNRPTIRFIRKYYIIDSDGTRKQIDETQFLKHLEISKHIPHDSKDNLKFYIGDNFGHNVEIKADQQNDIQQLFHKWSQELMNLNKNQQIRKSYYIEDQNGQRKLLSEAEFQEYLQKFRNGSNLHMTYKFYQTDDRGLRTEINPYTLKLIGQSQVSRKYYVIDSDGNRREINATEYQRLSEKPHSFVSSYTNRRYYRIDSQGNRQEIHPESSQLQQTDQTDLDLKALEPGFETQPQSQIGQTIDESDLNQQVQQPTFVTTQTQIRQRPNSAFYGQYYQTNQINRGTIYGRPQSQVRPEQDLTQQIQQNKPNSGKLGQLEFGQEIDDSDLTQQQVEQQEDFSKPHSGKLQQSQLEFGQQIDDSDLTQQVQQPDFTKPHSGKLQRPDFGQQIDDLDLTQQVQQPDFGKLEKLQQPQLEFGQQIDDSDLTQQVQQPVFNKPQIGRLQRPEFGQQIDDSDLTQQVQQPVFSKPQIGRLQRPDFGQQIDDSDLTQQVQQPDFSMPHSGKLQRPEFGQQIDDSDLTQQVQQPDFSKPHSGKLQRPEFGQQVDDLDLTQQVQQPDFTKPHSGNLQRPEFGQQIDDFDLTQQVQQPDFGKPHSGKLQQSQLEFGQQIDDSDLTQQVQQPTFGKPKIGRLQRPEFGQQVDDLDLTQQVQQPTFGKPKISRLQRPEFGQQVDDLDLTQQVQQPTFGKPKISRLQRPEFGQQIDDSDLTQQVQQPDFTMPHSGNLQKQEQLEFGQQTEDLDLTQHVQQPVFGKPEKLQQSQLEFGQQIDDSDLTQQVQQPDFTKPHSGNLQRPEFGQQIDDFDLTQQVQQPDFGKPHSGKLQQSQLEFGQQIDDSDLTQQVQQPDFTKPHSGNLQQQPEFGQQVDDFDLTQQVQQPDFSKPHSGSLQRQEQLEFGRQTQPSHRSHYRRPDLYHGQEIQLTGNLEFGQQIDDSDLTQQVQQPNFGKIQDITINNLEDDFDQQQAQKQQTFEQPIEPQISNQQNIDQNQRLTEAQQTSQQLIDALRNNLDTSSQQMVYVPRPVYSTLDIDGHQHQVPVGTTRHISQTSHVDPNYKPSNSHINLNYQSPYRRPSASFNTYSSYGTSQPQYSSGGYNANSANLNQEEQSSEVELANNANTGIKTKVIVQNSQKQQEEIEDNVTEVITTTEAPSFWRRLGNKVKSKAQSIRESIG